MIFLGAWSLFGAGFMATISLATKDVFAGTDVNQSRVVIWSILSLVMAGLQIFFGIKLLSQSQSAWDQTVRFVLAYIVIMESVLYYTFGMEFIRSYGFLGFLIIPAVYLVLLALGKKQIK
jgi:hypothetical protein